MTQMVCRHFLFASALMLAGSAGCVHAQTSNPEKLKLRAGISMLQDSNFLRAIDSKAAADQINTQTFDAGVALPYGQQRFELDANLSTSKHNTFSEFDYTGFGYNAAWRWSLTPSLVGMLSSKRTETLNSTADSVNPALRNTNVTRSDTLSAGYLIGGPWQLFAEYSKGASSNERALLGSTNIDFQSYTAGVSYVPSAGKSLSYSNRLDIGTSISDYRFSGNSIAASYSPSANTDIKARIGYIEQHFSIAPRYDFEGVNGSIDGIWRMTAKTSINTNWSRDISSFQTQESSHARTDMFSISPKWQIGPTLALSFARKWSQRDALGALNVNANLRQDKIQETNLDVSWEPRKHVSLRGGFATSARATNVADQDYSAQTLSFGAQFNY